MPTVQVDAKTLEEWVRKGLIPPEMATAKGRQTARKAAKKRASGLVDPGFVAPGSFIVPLKSASEVNRRDWRGRSRRTQDARAAMSKVLGPNLRHLAPFAEAYAAGKPLRVVFTRLGGSKLDRSNLPTATKGCEDFLALVMGCDDGDARWRAEWEQEPGGPMGVRIELSILGEG